MRRSVKLPGMTAQRARKSIARREEVLTCLSRGIDNSSEMKPFFRITVAAWKGRPMIVSFSKYEIISYRVDSISLQTHTGMTQWGEHPVKVPIKVRSLTERVSFCDFVCQGFGGL